MLEELIHIFVYPGFLFALVLGLFYLGVDRKLVARFHNRIGPPIWQQFIDVIKLFSKETIKPKLASGFFLLAPAVSLAALLTVTLMLPILGSVVYSSFDNVILVIYFLLLSFVFTALGGFSAGNPFSTVGSVRKITQMLAVEFPFLVALFTTTLVVGSLSLTDIVQYQFANDYLAFSLPFATIAFLIAVQGELRKTPFDIPDAKQEIVAGPYREYSGSGLALFELVHAVKFVIIVSLAVILFFGGANTIHWFLFKFFSLSILITVIRVLFSRIKIDQTFKFFWLFVGPLALIDLLRVILL
jgi:NADH-quinone oxidoreductase subunit H